MLCDQQHRKMSGSGKRQAGDCRMSESKSKKLATQPSCHQPPLINAETAQFLFDLVEKDEEVDLKQQLKNFPAEFFSELLAPTPGSKWMKKAYVPLGNASNYRCTCLHMAAILGRPHLCRLLLDKGVDPNVKDSQGNNVLIMAAAGGNVETVKMITEAGGHASDVSRCRVSALHVACRQGSKQVVEILLQQAGVDISGQSMLMDEIPLFCAAYHGHIKVAQLLLQKGADVNQAIDCGLTPIHMAARSSKSEMIDFLARSGANVNALAWVIEESSIELRFPFKDHGVHKGSPLNFAVESTRDGKSVKMLLIHGANPDVVTSLHPRTPLMIAAKKLKLNVVKILLEAGARLDYPDLHASSPLLCAITGYVSGASWEVKEATVMECVKVLVEAGASLTATNIRYQQNCMHLSVISELPKVFEYLMEHGGDPFSEDCSSDPAFRDILQGTAGNCRPWILCCLRGGAISHRCLENYYHMSPLEYAFSSGDMHLVKMYNRAGFLQKKYFKYMFDMCGRTKRYIDSALKQVLTLKKLSRKAVSDAIGMRAGKQAGITDLPVKEEIRSFLLYNDLEPLLVAPPRSAEPWFDISRDKPLHSRANIDTDTMRRPYESDAPDPDWSASEEEEEGDEGFRVRNELVMSMAAGDKAE